MSSFHITNFGAFGTNIVADMRGYAHTTAEEWLAAPVDEAGGAMTDEDAEWLAEQVVAQMTAAELELSRWRESLLNAELGFTEEDE